MASPSHFTDEHFTPTAITAALPIVVTVPGSAFLQGQALRFTRFYNVGYAPATGMEQLNNRLLYVGFVDGESFTLTDVNGLPIDGRNYTPFTGDGDPQITLTGPDLFVENPAPPPPP